MIIFSWQTNEDSLSELAESRMQTPADAEIQLAEPASSHQSGPDSEHSTPVGSSLSLNDDSAEYHIPAMNQFSVSVPNLSSPSTSQSGEDGRQNPLRLMSRATRAVFASAADTSRAETLLVALEDSDAGPLSTAQSFPTLSQQECLVDPLRFAPNARTQAFLQALRSLSNENGVWWDRGGSFAWLSLCLSVCLSICLNVCLSIRMFVCLSACPPV